MDIIAAHQQGLTEQLEEEVAALAGRARDHGQRAMVLHHLYDHSRGAHAWALAEARRALRIAEGLEALAKRLGRWGWLLARPRTSWYKYRRFCWRARAPTRLPWSGSSIS